MDIARAQLAVALLAAKDVCLVVDDGQAVM